MSRDHTAVLDALLDRHGQTFAAEAGFTVSDKPAQLFELLVLTSLLSANLDPPLGIRAAAALRKAGLRTAEAMTEAGQDRRHEVLVEAKYLRKEQTARQLGELAAHALDAYGGDLRRLRDEAADADDVTAAVEEALTGFAGVGPLGARIFCREVQTAWPTLQPYADDRVLATARELGLPHTPRGLADAAGTEDLAVLGAALVRCERAGDAEELR